jgi:hypothetical protein
MKPYPYIADSLAFWPFLRLPRIQRMSHYMRNGLRINLVLSHYPPIRDPSKQFRRPKIKALPLLVMRNFSSVGLVVDRVHG